MVNIKTIFGMFLNRGNSAFSVSDSLPLVQLIQSKSFCLQPETNHELNRLATSIS